MIEGWHRFCAGELCREESILGRGIERLPFEGSSYQLEHHPQLASFAYASDVELLCSPCGASDFRRHGVSTHGFHCFRFGAKSYVQFAPKTLRVDILGSVNTIQCFVFNFDVFFLTILDKQNSLPELCL